MSNISKLPNISIINEEAAKWIVLLDAQELSEDSLKELAQWMQQSPLHREKITKQAELWGAMDALQELSALFPLPAVEPSLHKNNNSNNKNNGVLGLLAALFRPRVLLFSFAPLAALFFSLVMLFSTPAAMVLTTKVGEISKHTLSDGTQVLMNTDSELVIEFSATARIVKLTKGEVNFNVVKNPKIPFIVYAGEGIVWAVGTEFVVRNLGEFVDVIVTEGQVKVFSDTKKSTDDLHISTDFPIDSKLNELTEALVSANESLSFDNVIHNYQSEATENLHKKIAWKEGAIILNGETLSQAMKEIMRYTDKKIIITDPSLNQLTVGGRYKTKNIDELLSTIAEVWQLDVQYTLDDKILISSI